MSTTLAAAVTSARQGCSSTTTPQALGLTLGGSMTKAQPGSSANDLKSVLAAAIPAEQVIGAGMLPAGAARRCRPSAAAPHAGGGVFTAPPR